jgi:hypothetical protein
MTDTIQTTFSSIEDDETEPDPDPEPEVKRKKYTGAGRRVSLRCHGCDTVKPKSEVEVGSHLCKDCRFDRDTNR